MDSLIVFFFIIHHPETPPSSNGAIITKAVMHEKISYHQPFWGLVGATIYGALTINEWN